MSTRKASHAGSWYSSDPKTLSAELDDWLAQVPSKLDGQDLPIAGARVIIAPHAGYAYSGPCTAYAYACLSLAPYTRRIFLLGPSHAYALRGCALTAHAAYATPLGDLAIDTATVADLHARGRFETMSTRTDEVEHSLEMHLPYIHKVITQQMGAAADHAGQTPPLLVPILVGNTTPEREREYGALLAPYLADRENTFIVSSDFCHWGCRFDYTYYLPYDTGEGEAGSGDGKAPTTTDTGHHLRRRDADPSHPRICDSIGMLDAAVMRAVERGSHAAFWTELTRSGNTVCGRHPIGVLLAALEAWRGAAAAAGLAGRSHGDDGGDGGDVVQEGGEDLAELAKTPWGARNAMRNRDLGRFSFVRYERSGDVLDVEDSSVSYASAYAVLE